MKKIVSLMVLIGLLITLTLPKIGNAKLRDYYSGTAVDFNGQTVVASTNMQNVEIFAIVNGKLVRQSSFGFRGENKTGKDGFYDVAMRVEGGRLFAYLVDGPWLYKYDITDQKSPVLVNQQKDTTWDWMMGVRLIDNGLVTTGTKGVKIYNKNLETIDSLSVTNVDGQYSVRISNDGKKLVSIDDNKISVYDFASHKLTAEIKINSKEKHGRKVAMTKSGFYVADDKRVMYFDYLGNLLKSVDHQGQFGYDLVASTDGKFVYASAGNHVLKLDAKTLKVVKKSGYINYGGKDGWAMGLDQAGKNLVVFNGGGIVILDQNFKITTGTLASVEAVKPWMPVTIKLSETHGYFDAPISIKGEGFGYSEVVKVNFLGNSYQATTNDKGAFAVMVRVPKISAGQQVVSFTGVKSGVKYQSSFTVDK